MPKRSAGLLLYRHRPDGSPEFLLVHPGGPFWARRDLGSWSIPKGEYGPDEFPLAAARREFAEETGFPAPGPDGALALGDIVQAGGKLVTAFAFQGDLDPADLRSNTFTVEWPPGSGRLATYPEVDRAAWFTPDEARRRILPTQAVLIDRCLAALSGLPFSREPAPRPARSRARSPAGRRS
ncbi:NUDIX domain-containing protein [Enterovirga sp.]|jgi:predicted NUDIX family NTP pyrophosphohydrolase|uniref:NUDIX domain-containing protein n=1 Tax=Enterovirga sp. TaxID=2026350 RepID=UPI00262B36F1|nr:NUDIX domain-containing protein [Enterovirga sp.]MDB5591534.1 hydrolase [Enterovirga sp.]